MRPPTWRRIVTGAKAVNGPSRPNVWKDDFKGAEVRRPNWVVREGKTSERKLNRAV